MKAEVEVGREVEEKRREENGKERETSRGIKKEGKNDKGREKWKQLVGKVFGCPKTVARRLTCVWISH